MQRFSSTDYYFLRICIFIIVFTKRGLEKLPTFAVPASETFLMEKPGASKDLEITELLDLCLHRLRERTKQRRLLAKPCFQDFDK